MGKYIDLDTGLPALWAKVKSALSGKVDSGYVTDGVAHFTGNGTELFTITGIGGGGGSGGGGSDNNAKLTVTNSTGWLSRTISEGSDCSISIYWTSIEDRIPTGNGTLTITVNSTQKLVQDVAQGTVTVNLKNYLSTGTNAVKVTISDVYDNTRSINFTVNVIALILRSTFDPSTPKEGEFNFSYTPIGDVDKTVYFIVDDRQIGREIVTTTGRQQTFTIPAQTHGAHTLRVYFEAVINNQTVRSNELFYDIICASSGTTSPIIASSFTLDSVDQYSMVSIPYTIYDPLNLTASATLKVDGETVSTVSVDRTTHVWNYRVDTPGRHTFSITVRSVTRTFKILVVESDVDAVLTTQDLVLSLSAAGRSNAETNPGVWTDGTTSCVFTGFNFTSDGWIDDGNGNVVLRVSGDARVRIPYKPFRSDFKPTGKTIEIDFATRDVIDYDAVILSCMDSGRGIELTANNASFRSEQSVLTNRYKENEHIRLSIVAEEWQGKNRLLYMYLNGIMTGVIQYPADNDFSQANPQDIYIGSNYCTVDIYAIRIYDNDLTRQQILDNWIADTQNAEEMLRRYEHNNVLENDNVVISKLPTDLPYMIISCRELPQFKGDKKGTSEDDPVYVQYIDPVTPSKSFTATGVQLNVQGTSSAVYARKNYDLQFKGGFDIGETHEKNYALRDTVVPFNRFVLKADVASSEGANNVELVRLFVDINPYKFQEKIDNPKVREGIDGFPIVLFWNDTVNNTTQFMGKYNFNLPKRAPGPYGYSGNDESWEFQNNTSSLMLFHTDYFDESMYTDPDTGDTKERWRFDYEARFPDDTWVDYSKLQELESFIYSTYRPNATNNTLSSPVTYAGVTYTTDSESYRLAKFRAEFGNYAEIDSFIFYYVFTELFLMVDSRAKNLFIGFHGSATDPALGLTIDRKAVAEPYDMDTAIGINNEGVSVFGYSLEDTDHLEGGADIFNGQESTLWCNLRDAFPNEISTVYRNLRSAGLLSYANVENRFEEHQSKWPEAIFNEDSYFKYLAPLTDPDPGKEPTNAYLSMLHGSKKQQRMWWLYNRFRYMDSKYNTGDALTDIIQLRGYAKSDITVIPYADVYATIKYGSYFVQARAERNRAYTLACPLDNVNDTEIYIYSASQLSSIGDLSGLKVGFADFSNGTKLTSLKVGDASPTYNNSNLKTLYVGTNGLLQTIDVRNCSALGTDEQTSVDLSGATNIENVYFDGTAVKSVVLPNGGILKVLHLPSTITNLTIRNQTQITEFVMPSYANITTLRLENVNGTIPEMDILEGMPAGSRIRITGFTWSVANLSELDEILDVLDTMRGISAAGINEDHAYLSVAGDIYVDAELNGGQITPYRERGYQYINFIARKITATLTYKTYDGSQTLFTETIVSTLVDGEFIAGNGTKTHNIARAATAQYTFTPNGWSSEMDGDPEEDILIGVTENKTIYAAYDKTVNTYVITWKNADNSIILISRNVPYGDTPVYSGITPQYDGQTSYGWNPEIVPVTGNATYTAAYLPTYTANFYLRDEDGGTLLYTRAKVVQGKTATYGGPTPVSIRGDATQYRFDGWVPALTAMYDDVDYYAAFTNIGSLTINYLLKNLTEFESNTLTRIVSYGLAHQYSLTDVTTSGTYFGYTAFNSNYNLRKIDFTSPSQITFESGALTTRGLRWLIIRSNSVAITKSTTPLSSTLINNNDGVVFVPSNLVNAYKEDSSWGAYHIRSIDEYPLEDISTISDSWSEIISHVNDGTYAERYSVGDTKLLEFGEYSCYMRIAAFDTDVLANGETVPITWIANNMPFQHRMNETRTADGGWEQSEMRSWLSETIFPLMPEVLRTSIKEVVKPYFLYDENEERNAIDKLWIPSIQEVNSTMYSTTVHSSGMSYQVTYFYPEETGVIYNGIFKARGYSSINSYRIRRYEETKTAWWTRTTCTSSYSTATQDSFGYVSSDGGVTYGTNSTIEYGVIIGFCT